MRTGTIAIALAGLAAAAPLALLLLPHLRIAVAGENFAALLPPVVALAGFAAFVALRRLQGLPAASLAALLVAAQTNGIGLGPFDVFDFAVGIVFVSWIATRAVDVDRPIALPPLIAIGALIVLVGIAHLPVASPVRWFIGVFGLFRGVLVAFLVVDLCRTAEDFRRVEFALLAVACASAAIGISQFLLAFFGIFQFTLIDPPISAFKPTPFGFVMRASGLCITAQHYSSFLVLAAPFALWRLSESWRLRDLALVVLLFAGIAVSWNFGALIALMVVCAILPFVRWPHQVLHIALALGAVAAIAYYSGLLQLLYDLSFGDAGVAKGVSQRHTLFELGLEKIARNPIVGTGPQEFARYDGNFWGRPVHNAFGQAASELGLVGALLLGAATVYLLTELGLRAFRPGPMRREAGILLAGLVGYLQLMQSEPNLDHANTWLAFGLAQALVLIDRS